MARGEAWHGSRRLSRPHETETAEAGAQGRMTCVVEKLAFSTWGSSHTKKRNKKKKNSPRRERTGLCALRTGGPEGGGAEPGSPP